MDWRQYDQALGRFNSIDKLSELAPNLSPFRFAFNNPVYWSDPSGLYESDNNGNIKITDTDEIKNFMSYLSNNIGASFNDMAEHIYNADNGFALELNEIVVVGNKKTGTYSEEAIFGAANKLYGQIQSAQNSMNNFSAKIDYGQIDFKWSGTSNSVIGGGLGGFAGTLHNLAKTQSTSFKTSYETAFESASEITANSRAYYARLAMRAGRVATGV